MLKIRTVRGVLKRRPWMSAAVVSTLLVGAGGGAWGLASDGSSADAQPSYRLAAATIATIKQNVSTTGTIEPADQESLNFAGAGRVTAVRVAAGERVTKGQVLGTIDSASLAAALAEAKATLATNQARVESDTAQGAAAAQLAADHAAVTAAQGQVASAQAAMAGATLRSPIDGVVATVGVAVGDQVTGSASNGNNSSNSSGGSAHFVVVGTTSWVVNATVDDTQIGLLKKGNQAEITTDGGTTVYGTISSVGLIATNTSGTATFPVVVKVTGNPSGLHAGATGTVSLIYRQLTNVLTVPSLAVHATNGRSYVETISGTKRVQHTVTTGLSSGGMTQIASGLHEGDQVVVDIPQINGTGSRGNSGGNGGAFPPGGSVQLPGGNVVIDKGPANQQNGTK